MIKKFSTSLAPFTSFKRSLIGLFEILQFWKIGQVLDDIPSDMKGFFVEYFDDKKMTFVGSGRESLFYILQNLNLPGGSKVVLQGCTCVVVPNAIIGAGLEPIWCDIDKSNLNYDFEKLEEILKKGDVKVVITQDTFGIPCDRDKMKTLKDKYEFIWIEDLAHSFSNKWGNIYLGNFGDFAFLSFGRDKMFSACSGGVVVGKVKARDLAKWKFLDVFRLLMYEVAMPFLKLDSTGVLLKLFFKFKLLPKVIDKCEKMGKVYTRQVRGFPKNFVSFFKYEMQRFHQNIEHRKKLRNRFDELLSDFFITNEIIIPKDVTLLRYPAIFDRSDDLLKFAKNYGVYLGDWYRNGVDPVGVSFESIKFDSSKVLVANEICPKLINFPMYLWVSRKEIESIKTLILNLNT